MSKHSFSVLTSDIRRNPQILTDMVYEASVRNPSSKIRWTDHGPVTTVTAVAA